MCESEVMIGSVDNLVILSYRTRPGKRSIAISLSAMRAILQRLTGKVPQGLKPNQLLALYGTAKAVPFQISAHEGFSRELLE